jgi:putative tryptophan/tyrosine transport system substrate-binding protein
MKRREFIALVGMSAAWPAVATAQQQPILGLLSSTDLSEWAANGLRAGLEQSGYVEGRNLTVIRRSAENQFDRLPALAAELVKSQVSIIFATGSPVPARTAKAATSTIPIVFAYGGDPVSDGLVESFNRPGGNVTGLSIMSVELGAKRLGLLHELIPGALRIAALINPNSSIAPSLIREAQTGASTIGWQVEVVYARTKDEVDAAFGRLGQQRIDAVFISADQFFTSRRVQFATLAAHYRVPAIYSYRAFAEVGGLMSYGPNLPDQYRQLGVYTGRILKGQKPADLPVQAPTKFALVINLQTAKTLGLTIPPGVLAIADEVIE